MLCPRCRAEIPAAGKCPKCNAATTTVPPGARIVVTKAPDESGVISGIGRTMMDLGPSGAPTQAVFSLTQPETVIGRADGCDIQLNHSTVSKQHAKIDYRDGGFWVEDLGSVNGVRVNDEEVERRKLTANDTLKIGKFVLVFVAPDRSATGKK